jgi:hypothetical protein
MLFDDVLLKSVKLGLLGVRMFPKFWRLVYDIYIAVHLVGVCSLMSKKQS